MKVINDERKAGESICMDVIKINEIIELAGKLIKYADHTENCKLEMRHHNICICGISALAKEFIEKVKTLN